MSKITTFEELVEALKEIELETPTSTFLKDREKAIKDIRDHRMFWTVTLNRNWKVEAVIAYSRKYVSFFEKRDCQGNFHRVNPQVIEEYELSLLGGDKILYPTPNVQNIYNVIKAIKECEDQK